MAKLDSILIFDLIGKMAHFRKFYTNSSSLSYHIPPRSTISGTIAAIMGLEKDSYYDLLSPKHSRIAISLRTPTRSIMQTVNSLLTTTLQNLSGYGYRTQIPTEIVVPEDGTSNLKYRVFFWHDQFSIMEDLGARLKGGKSSYPISLGTASMISKALFVDWPRIENIKIMQPADHDVDVVTPCPVEAINFKEMKGKNRSIRYIKDIMPFAFGDNRSLTKNIDFVYEKGGAPMPVRLNMPYVNVIYATANEVLSENLFFSEDYYLGEKN